MGKNETDKTEKYNIYKILCIILLIILIVVLCLWAKDSMTERNAEETYDRLQEAVNSTANENTEIQDDTEAEVPEVDIENTNETISIDIPQKNIDWEKMHSTNPDIYAWIYIPNTNVDYPVLQSASDNEYYLNHNIDGSRGKPGCIYTENLNSKEFTDYNTVIYGHNMKSGSMFNTLHKFENRSFFDENKYVYIYTEDKVFVYEIFAAYTTDDSHILNTNDFSSAEGAQKYIEKINRDAADGCSRDEITVSSENAIITLSTCTSVSDERYLVQAVLVNE